MRAFFVVEPSKLAEADSADGVADLLAHLGFVREIVAIPREAFPEFGFDPFDAEPQALYRVARHRGLSVLLLVVERPADRALARRLAGRLHHHNRGARRLLVLTDPRYERLTFTTWGLGEGAGDGSFTLHFASLNRLDPRRADLEILRDLSPGSVESSTELAWRHAQALDRERVTQRFYRAVRCVREDLALAWTGVPRRRRGDRLELALLALCRLLFLTFLQQKGWLDGDPHYLRHLCEQVTGRGGRLFRDAFVPLFFGALNTRPRERRPEARVLGSLPFLNGGLFEPYPIERRWPDLDAPNEPFARLILEVLERYRFTVQENTPLDHDAAVDPEMLGKVFEGLMQERARAATGAFYTPRGLVTHLVDGAVTAYLDRAVSLGPEAARALVSGLDAAHLDKNARAQALEALRRLRILDPAVGSGAFLLAALHKIEALIRCLAPGDVTDDRCALRKQIVHENLYGVDRNAAAVRLCELRLWLALVVDLEVSDPAADIPPLPNLDHKIRQGDTLLDPVDALATLIDHGRHLDLWAAWRRGVHELETLKNRYVNAWGGRKERLGRALVSRERTLARRLLVRLTERAAARARDLEIVGRGRDLFGNRAAYTPEQRAALRDAQRARRDIRALARRLQNEGELPFFSWAVHFSEVHAHGGFDIVLGNPPWVRPHRLCPRVRETLRSRYRVGRAAAWTAGAALSGAGPGFASQVDLAALFVERGLELLRPGGVLAFLLPAKIAHALYAGGLRAQLAERVRIIDLDDRSRSGARPFLAVTFPLAMVCRKERPTPDHPVRITLRSGRRAELSTRCPQALLPLWPHDPGAPWCLVPAALRETLGRMVAAGLPVAKVGFTPARGILTGANSVFCLAHVEPRSTETCHITAEGYASAPPSRRPRFQDEVETRAVRPLLRGEDIRAWRQRPSRWVLLTHDPETARPLARLPPRLGRYLANHEGRLKKRKDLRPKDPFWSLFRVTRAKLGPCVAWRDIGRKLEAVALPGLPTGPVPLNTIYLIPTPNAEVACALAALFNSRLVSAFLTTFAERAAGGFFRFFAWTVGCLPLPGRWSPADPRVAQLAELGARGHAQGALADAERDALEAAVADLYALTDEDVRRLIRYDEFLERPTSDVRAEP